MSCRASIPARRVRRLARDAATAGGPRTRSARLLAGVVLVAACGVGGSNATAPSAETADMSAMFLENTWFTPGRASASYRDQVLSFSGNDGWYTVSVVLQGVGGPGSYSVTPGNPEGSYATVTGAGKAYSSLLGGGGQVVVDSLWTSGASGTFAFTVLNPTNPHQDVIVVKDGVFHVRF